MKRFKYIASALVLSTALMGAGYAFWTNSVTLTGYVNAGDLNVDFVNQGATSRPPIQKKYPDCGISVNDYSTAKILHNNNKSTTLSIDNMYPGITAWFRFKIKNTGSIPANINDITIANNKSSSSLNENLTLSGSYEVYCADGSKKRISGYPVTDSFESTFGDLESTINSLLQDIQLDVGEFITLEISITLPDDEYTGNNTKGQNIEFDMQFNFKQWNAQ